MERRQLLKTGLAIATVVAAAPQLIEKSIITRDGHSLPVTPNPDFDFGDGDWTMEYWTKGPMIDEIRVTQGVARYTARFTPPDIPDDNKWHHVAFVREGNVETSFVDGEPV